MPAGCEFICENPICESFKKGFLITGNWPMAPIELVIANLNPINVVQDAVRKQFIALKDEGRKLALITFPNDAKISTTAYRVSLWSEDAKCVWNYDVPIEEMETWIPPEKCPKTGGKLYSFNEIVELGINCPSCNAPLKQSRWFTKEAAKEAAKEGA